MKRFLLAITILLTCIGLNAQSQKCNRLFLHIKGEDATIYNMNKVDSLSFGGLGFPNCLTIHNSNGVLERFDIDYLDSLTFNNIEGRVAADINIIEHDNTSVKFDITRTASCEGFKLMLMDYNSIISLGTNDLIYYLENNAGDTYYQDFEGVEIKDLDLLPNTEYAVVTVGIDKYGLLCDVAKARFATAADNLVGNPKVTVEVTQNELNAGKKCDFTLSFTPNSETSKYSIFVAEAGVTEYQYVMFRYMEGWENMGDMVEGWGLEFNKKDSYQFTNETPGTLYEVYIQASDVNGVRAPYEVFTFRTQGLGGEGTASVDIKLGEYVMAEWINQETFEWELMPSQFFTFTPNDQTNAYRFDVMLEETYLSDIDGHQEELCSDPFMPTDGWFQYETLTTDYQINPGLKCVAIAAAKNSLGEWGPVTELYFTTPDNVPGEDDDTTVELKVDKNTILANGKDVATFTVKVNGKTLESGYILFEDGVIYNDNKFHTTETGTFSFIAKYNGVESNEVVIEAVSDETNKVELIADKTSIKNNGTDKVTFTVLVNDVDVTNEATIFNVTDNKNLDGNTFSSTNNGTYVFNATYNDVKSNDITVTVKTAQVYAPGDFYEEDGVEGVVFYVTDGGTSGYIMSLDEAVLQWSTENVWANCISVRGEWNTEDMLKLGADKYPAAKWCADHGDGWFMPSSRELGWMWNAVTNGTLAYDREFIKLYNDKLEDPISEDYYWSSNETSESLAEVVVFIDDSVVCLDPQKSSYFCVRAVRKF